MNIDPREQAHAYDDWHVEDVPEPEMPEDRSEVRQVPEAVAAADVTKRKDTTVETPATDEMTGAAEAAEVEQKLEEHRARGIEWVRPTDLLARQSATLAGRGIDFEAELAVVTGDVSQIDLPKGAMSGLIDAERVLKRVKGIAINRFTTADVVRHPLVARIVDAYDRRAAATAPGNAG